jgi:uncharacterized protein YjiS (DUF1127 family)
MTMHLEQSAIRPPFTRLTAAIRARFKAWREQRAERAQIDALEALGPEILDDIGIRIVKGDKPANFLPVFNPYGIVAAAVFAPRPAERDEF